MNLQIESLQRAIKETLDVIAEREKIMRKDSEGEITITFPSPLSDKPEFVVSINSYFLRGSGLENTWSAKTLQGALQKTLVGIQSWYQLEIDSPLSIRLLQDYE